MGDEQEARLDDGDKLGEIDWVIDSIPDPIDVFGDDFQFFLGDFAGDHDIHLLNELEQILLNDEVDESASIVVDCLDDKYGEFGDILNAESPPQGMSSEESPPQEMSSEESPPQEMSSEEEKEDKGKNDVSDDQPGGLNVESPGQEVKNEEKKRKIDEVCDDSDPMNKKLKRQIRNRYSAHQSRERKKAYMRDLETKSMYLEAECRRLENLLRHCLAENQSLHLQLQHGQKDKAFDVVMGQKQESAVLSLESLLLGSLLWLMNIVCLFLVAGLLPRADPKLEIENMVNARGGKEQENEGPRGNDTVGPGLRVGLILLSRSCRGTRKKMKVGFLKFLRF